MELSVRVPPTRVLNVTPESCAQSMAIGGRGAPGVGVPSLVKVLVSDTGPGCVTDLPHSITEPTARHLPTTKSPAAMYTSCAPLETPGSPSTSHTLQLHHRTAEWVS